MEDFGHFEDLFDDPFNSIGHLVENAWAGAESKWEDLLKVEFVVPMDAEKWPVLWAHWYQTKSPTDVKLGQEAASAQA